jgi:hypothetical protein
MWQNEGDVDRQSVSLFVNRLRNKFHAFCSEVVQLTMGVIN